MPKQILMEALDHNVVVDILVDSMGIDVQLSIERIEDIEDLAIMIINSTQKGYIARLTKMIIAS